MCQIAQSAQERLAPKNLRQLTGKNIFQGRICVVLKLRRKRTMKTLLLLGSIYSSMGPHIQESPECSQVNQHHAGTGLRVLGQLQRSVFSNPFPRTCLTLSFKTPSGVNWMKFVRYIPLILCLSTTMMDLSEETYLRQRALFLLLQQVWDGIQSRPLFVLFCRNTVLAIA